MLHNLLLLGACNDDNLVTILCYVAKLFGYIQIIIPIALIVWGGLDLGKAVIAGDEKDIRENRKVLLKRVLAAVLVFLIVPIVTFIMGFVGTKQWVDCWEEAKAKSSGGTCNVTDIPIPATP